MIDTPQVLESAAQHTAVIRFTIPKAQIREVMGPAMQEVIATVKQQGIGPAGPLFSRHFRIHPEVWDFEVGVPVHTPVTPAGRVIAAELPARRIASTTYHGGYEGLGAAWGEFDRTLAAAGHTASPELWECYLSGPETPPAETRIELNRPLI